MNFKDYFSMQSIDYAKYRPRYPTELFSYLASLATARHRAWDCATGNGQAAVGLAEFFDEVIATDGSESQIKNAMRHARVNYRVATAENSGIESSSIDLLMVAQALHWFDLDKFYAEARRVLKSAGVVAASCYNLLEISPEIDPILHKFYKETVGPFWPPERALVEDCYLSLPFPFKPLQPPPFYIEARWSLRDLAGYLSTWSATQRYIKAQGHDPVLKIADELMSVWGKPEEEKLVRWPLSVRVGIKE